jgi:membrane associated rhomboid family serine protease
MQIYITYFIIGITCMVSIPAMGNAELKGKLLFNAWAIRYRKEWWRLLTHALVHADWMHLMMNMYVLYMFGQYVEIEYEALFFQKAHLFFILLYVGGIFMSSVYSYEKNKDNMYYNALGASGAVSAIVFTHILIMPKAGMGLIFIPGIFIPSWIFGGLYLLYSWYMGKRGNDNIGHDAHFWGAVYGIAFTLCLKPSLAAHFIAQITGHTEM